MTFFSTVPFLLSMLLAAQAVTLSPALAQEPPDSNISALAWDGEGLWVGYFDAGLARYEDGRWTVIAIDGAPVFSWINALCWDGETLWVGSNGGLSRWNAQSRALETVLLKTGAALEGSVQSVRYDSGVLVVAGSNKVWVRRQQEAWEAFELPGEALHSAFMHRGTLWVAGMRGVLERHNGGWRRYSQLNGRLPHSWVTSLLAVGGELWAGTYDAGLVALTDRGAARMLRSGAWVNFNALVPVEGGVAVGTMGDGLLLLDYATKSWTRLSTETGLPSDDVTAVVETPGVLWVGTRSGLAELSR